MVTIHPTPKERRLLSAINVAVTGDAVSVTVGDGGACFLVEEVAALVSQIRAMVFLGHCPKVVNSLVARVEKA